MYIWIELKYIEEDYINLHYYIQFKGRGRDWWGVMEREVVDGVGSSGEQDWWIVRGEGGD